MIREFHLSPRGGGGLACDSDGAFFGAVPLLDRLPFGGEDEWQPRNSHELSKEMGDRYGLPIDMTRKTGGLKAVAKALNEGDVARAQIAAVLLGIPDPPPLTKSARAPGEMTKLIRDLHWSGLLKVDWDPEDHPRWPAGAPDSAGGQFAPKDEGSENFWEAIGASLKHEVKSALLQIGRAELAESNANLAADTAEARVIVHALKAYAEYRTQPWIGPDGVAIQVPVINTGDPLSDQTAFMGHELFEPNAPLMRSATNADWVDPLINLASMAAMAAGPIVRLAGPATEAIDTADVAVPAAEGGVLIGNSRYSSIGKFTDAVTAKYQALYDQGYSISLQKASAGLIANDPLVIGSKTDLFARVGLRDWLTNVEGIDEGPAEIIRVNRRLYDPLGSGDYRVPDVYVPDSQVILDGSLQFKGRSMPQIQDYQAFSQGAKIIIVRPSTAPSDVVAGTYGIVH